MICSNPVVLLLFIYYYLFILSNHTLQIHPHTVILVYHWICRCLYLFTITDWIRLAWCYIQVGFEVSHVLIIFGHVNFKTNINNCFLSQSAKFPQYYSFISNRLPLRPVPTWQSPLWEVQQLLVSRVSLAPCWWGLRGAGRVRLGGGGH